MKKERYLWILLIILIITILSIIMIIIFNQEEKEENYLEQNHNPIVDKITNNTWLYSYSDYYDINNNISETVFSSFKIKFSDTKVEFCFEENCHTSSYKINDNILNIDSIQNFSGEYIVSIEGDGLVLDYKNSDGSRIVYYFEQPIE